MHADLVNGVAVLVLGTLMVGVIGWLVRVQVKRRDKRLAVKWLKENTRDEPSESHVTAKAIAKGIGISEERARQACIACREIHMLQGGPDLFSVWRKEKQSVYDTRGIISI